MRGASHVAILETHLICSCGVVVGVVVVAGCTVVTTVLSSTLRPSISLGGNKVAVPTTPVVVPTTVRAVVSRSFECKGSDSEDRWKLTMGE